MQQITEAASRTLAQQLSTLFRGSRKITNIISPTLCEKAISRLDLSAYKNPILIDMAPGICTWSAAIHDALKPRAHLLLEPELAYKPWIEEFQATRRNTYWLPEAGDRWGLYFNMFGQSQPPIPRWPADYPNITPRTVPPDEGVNTDIIFTGNLSESDTMNNRFLAQLIATIPRERWLMTFGRVRFLMWITDETKIRYLPRTVAGRFRATVMAEAVCDVTEVVSSNTVLVGTGYPKAAEVFKMDENGKIVLKTEQEMLAEKEDPMEGRRRGRPRGSGRKPPTKEEMAAAATTTTPPKTTPPKTTQTPPPSRTSTLKTLISEIVAADGSPVPAIPITTIVATLSALVAKYLNVDPSTPPLTIETPLSELRQLTRKLLMHHKARPSESSALSIIQAKLKELERSHRISIKRLESRLSEFLADPVNEGAWFEGLDHPAWYYKQNLQDLALHILRRRKQAAVEAASEDGVIDDLSALKGGRSLRQVRFDESLLGRFERDEEVKPPPLPQEETEEGDRKRKRVIDGWNKNWGGSKNLAAAQDDIRADEIYSFEHKLLEYYRRDYEPITAQPTDFYPETPLALLDFTPKLLHPYLRNKDLSQRDQTFETFLWLLRTLFLLRAHPVSSALSTLAPGGEHILDNLAPGVHIDPDQRLRTLTADDFVEITRAWETWPFRGELAHLGLPLETVLGGKDESLRVKTALKFKGKGG